MKKAGGCEIEAKGINYNIKICNKRDHPLKIWSRDEEEEEEQQQCQQEPKEARIKATKATGHKDNAQCRIRQVLKNVCCHAKPGEILAIVGPSGAGKSTLLEILAGRLTPATPPEILVNRKPANKSEFRRISGYVTQRDVLFPLLTVRETLTFSARLRLGAGACNLRARVESLLSDLSLGRVSETRVKELSGGERRRVSIGVEAVHDPAVLILDEPTSGLDSASAMQIVAALRAMAEGRGRTVILSIHQPGARIVKMFGAVILLAGGSVLHHGTVDSLHQRINDAGLQLPVHTDVVEYAIDSIDALRAHQRRSGSTTAAGELLQEPATLQPIAKKCSDAAAEVKRDRCTLQQLFQIHKVADEETATAAIAITESTTKHHYANSRPREVAVLAHRFFKNVARTRQLFACRTICMLIAGLALGSIFYNLSDDKFPERVGLFAFALSFLLSSTTEALPIFLQEREILMKETSCGSYRVSSYVIANAIVFVPFLAALALLFAVPVYWLVGLRRDISAFAYFLLLIWLVLYTANSVVVCITSAAPDFVVGNAAIAGVMGSFFLFSGYFISKSAMPGCWVFMHYLSLFKWPFEALLVNEFSGSDRCVVSELGVCLARGGDLLQQQGLGEGMRWKNVGVMVGFILAYRVLGYLVLKVRCKCAQNGGLRRVMSSSSSP